MLTAVTDFFGTVIDIFIDVFEQHTNPPKQEFVPET